MLWLKQLFIWRKITITHSLWNIPVFIPGMFVISIDTPAIRALSIHLCIRCVDQFFSWSTIIPSNKQNLRTRSQLFSYIHRNKFTICSSYISRLNLYIQNKLIHWWLFIREITMRSCNTKQENHIYFHSLL